MDLAPVAAQVAAVPIQAPQQAQAALVVTLAAVAVAAVAAQPQVRQGTAAKAVFLLSTLSALVLYLQLQVSS